MDTRFGYTQQIRPSHISSTFARIRTISSTGLRNAAPYAIHRLFRAVLIQYYTAIGRAYAAWWGVGLGSDSNFRGMPLFRKHPTSSITVGDHCTFQSSDWFNRMGGGRKCSITTFRNAAITIGHHTGMSSTVIESADRIDIGNHVLCGTRTTIIDFDGHALNPEERDEGGQGITAPVCIEDHVMLAQNVLVLKGVTIGHGSIIAANSVVSRSIPPNVIAAGTPARVLGGRGNQVSQE